jgi:hypothetical protein
MDVSFLGAGGSDVFAALAGRSVLIIGGDRRPDQLRRLTEAFPSTRFEWIATRSSDPSLDRFAKRILDPAIACVVVLHGLARTAHTKGARRLASKAGKPLVWCWRPTVAALISAWRPVRPRAA